MGGCVNLGGRGSGGVVEMERGGLASGCGREQRDSISGTNKQLRPVPARGVNVPPQKITITNC